LKRDIRKTLILMTPKSLLRHKRAVSRLDEMGPNTTFHRLLVGRRAQMLPNEKIKARRRRQDQARGDVRRQVYFDFYEEREKRGINDVYLLRLEQLYPVPLKALVNELGRFTKAQFMWCQERATQYGRVSLMEPYLVWVLDQLGATANRPVYAGRPAVGVDGGRPDVEASGTAQRVPRRGAGVKQLLVMAGLAPASPRFSRHEKTGWPRQARP